MALASLSARGDDALPADTYDVRGWEVLTRRDDLRVGAVEDMLLDGSGWPRYLAVHVDASGRRVLVPLERAAAEPGRKQVFVRGLSADGFETLPSYPGDPERLGPEYEDRLLEHWDEGDRGEASDPDAAHHRHSVSLMRLSDADEHRVSSASTDVRGWNVILGDGRKLGTVSELLFDPDEMRVRYLDCDVYEDKLDLERVDRHVLLPVEHVRLEAGERHVVVDGLFSTDLGDYPVYGGLPLARDVERTIVARFRTRRHAGSGEGPGRWAARSFFGRRPGDEPAGAAAPAAAGSSRRETAPAGEDGITVRRSASGEDVAVVRKDGQEVRIRITGDDIVIEKDTGGEVNRG